MCNPIYLLWKLRCRWIYFFTKGLMWYYFNFHIQQKYDDICRSSHGIWAFERTILFMTFTKFIMCFKSYKTIACFFFHLTRISWLHVQKVNKNASCTKILNMSAFTQKQTNLLWTFPFSSCHTLFWLGKLNCVFLSCHTGI